MKGNWGKLLKVDLTTGAIEDWLIDEQVYRDYLGGSGLAAYAFFVLKGYEAEPLSPENPLIVANGPVSGTTLPGSSRLEICARSPLTGIWGEASMGGNFAPDLKGTGYDGIVFTGASKKPVYLFLTDQEAQLCDASHIWGKDTFETEKIIRQDLADPKTKIISIGEAGENLVKFAAVVNDRGSLAARSGMGAVMGSKNLKAVAVRGKKKFQVGDEEAYKRLRKTAIENIKHSLLVEGLTLFGTGGGVDISTAISDLPVKNWREPQWEEGMENLSGVNIADTFLKKKHSCYACPIACKRIVEIEAGGETMEEVPGPEYECLGALGFMSKIKDLPIVLKANALCNAYGMDAISTGGTIAYAIEAFQSGLINEHLTGGMVLDWNQPGQLIELIHKIAHREGFGDELAEGCRSMSEKYGGQEFAIQVKGMECPMHDPRALWSLGLSYATSIRGGCHNRDTNLGLEMGMDNLKEIGLKSTKPQRKEGKAEQTIHSQAIGAITDSMVICIFAWKGSGSGLAILRDTVNAVTGFEYTTEELLRTGQRIWYLKRAIGNLCGVTREDDQLPRRIITPDIDGYSSNLLRVLNPLLRMNEKTVNKITNERAMKILKAFNSKVVLRNMFRTITLAGKLVPAFGGRDRIFRRAEFKEKNSRMVDFDFMLDDFYRLRGIDTRGFPEKKVLDELGMEMVSEALYSNKGQGPIETAASTISRT
jgi:aldehyde:ferredoxin oxidoreductase